MYGNIIDNTNQILFTSIDNIWTQSVQFVGNTVLYISTLYPTDLHVINWLNMYFLDWTNYIVYMSGYNNNYKFLNNDIFFGLTSWINTLIFQVNCYTNLNTINKELFVLNNNLVTNLISYNFVFITIVVKYSFLIYIIYHITTYSYYNINALNTNQNSFLSKFLHIIDSEEELGSLDDALTIIFLFMIVFGWFFIFSLPFAYLFKTQFTLLGLGSILLITFILLTPLSTLLDFGISFTTYIRGASSGSNLLVECVFDIIGTLVVFTRFIVQNIRFVLIFFAYFELFEWTYNSSFVNAILQLLNFDYEISLENYYMSLNDITNLFYFLSLLITSIISYLYYLVHLLILIFVQVTIYLLISFWLFFFFYTSFTLNKTEKLFISKKFKICMLL